MVIQRCLEVQRYTNPKRKTTWKLKNVFVVGAVETVKFVFAVVVIAVVVAVAVVVVLMLLLLALLFLLLLFWL